MFADTVGISDRVIGLVGFLGFVAFAILPFAFLAGLVRTRYRPPGRSAGSSSASHAGRA